MEKIKELFSFYKKGIIVAIIVLLLFIICLSIYYLKTEKETNKIEDITFNEEETLIKEEQTETTEETIMIDIKGEVNNPGVYKLPINSRVIDAINAAGGLKQNASTENINLSQILNDQNVIIINNKEETNQNNIATGNDAQIKENNTITNKENTNEENTTNNLNIVVNINTASKEELMTLKGIGESKAEKIIEYRITNGPFQKIEDITNVSGIGEKMYESIKNNITV